MVIVHIAIYMGYEVFVMPQFDLHKFCTLVEQEKITYCNVVPRVISALAKDAAASKYNLSSLKMLVSAAAPLPNDLIKTLYRRFKIPVTQVYGMSEMSPATHQLVCSLRKYL